MSPESSFFGFYPHRSTLDEHEWIGSFESEWSCRVASGMRPTRTTKTRGSSNLPGHGAPHEREQNGPERSHGPQQEYTIGTTAPTHHVAENNFGTVWRLDLKKVQTKCFVEAKSPRQRCWKSGFWRMTFGCTCWTLELSSHIVKNLWSGTTETKSPQELLLARVPTIVMDILCHHHFHCQEAFRLLSSRQLHCSRDQVHAALSQSERNKSRSKLLGQTAIVSLDVSLASGL